MATTPAAAELPHRLEAAPTPTPVAVDRSKHWVAQATAGLFGLSLLAAAIHLLLAPEHLMAAAEGNGPWWLAGGFLLTAGAGATYAFALLAGAWGRGWLIAGITLNLAMAAVGVLGHTTGLPGLEAEPPTVALFVAVGAELVAAGCAVWLLTALGRPRGRVRLPAAAGLVLVVALLALAVVGGDTLEHARMLGTPLKWMW